VHPADSGVIEQNVVHQGRPKIGLLEIKVNIRDAGVLAIRLNETEKRTCSCTARSTCG
jgi:hypothetical protein